MPDHHAPQDSGESQLNSHRAGAHHVPGTAPRLHMPLLTQAPPHLQEEIIIVPFLHMRKPRFET